MLGNVYEKTDKGRAEIATRQNRLPARLRTLLLLIDGQRQLGMLANNFGPPELTAENAAILLRAELIVRVREPVLAVAPAPAPVADVTTQRDVAPAPVNMHDIYSSRRRY
jgi:hypothetical protein